MRSIDAVHLATALALGGDLGAAAYDGYLSKAAGKRALEVVVPLIVFGAPDRCIASDRWNTIETGLTPLARTRGN